MSNKEMKAAEIMELYDQLGDEGKAELAKAITQITTDKEMQELEQTLGNEPVPYGKTWADFQNYVKYRHANPKYPDPVNNELMLLIDIFNYGRICGIRQERARQKGGEQV